MAVQFMVVRHTHACNQLKGGQEKECGHKMMESALGTGRHSGRSTTREVAVVGKSMTGVGSVSVSMSESKTKMRRQADRK
jgi:hypothetical protein